MAKKYIDAAIFIEYLSRLNSHLNTLTAYYKINNPEYYNKLKKLQPYPQAVAIKMCNAFIKKFGKIKVELQQIGIDGILLSGVGKYYFIYIEGVKAYVKVYSYDAKKNKSKFLGTVRII